jgi:hypothetical protein
MSTVTRRRHPTLGVHSLNASHRAKHTCSRMPSRTHQQPRNRPSLRSVCPRRSFPRNLAPILMFPGRTRIVPPQHLSMLVPQLGLRSLQSPPRLPIRRNLAHVNLRPHGMRLQQNYLPSRSLNRIRHSRTCRRFRARQRAKRHGYCHDGECTEKGRWPGSGNHRGSLPHGPTSREKNSGNLSSFAYIQRSSLTSKAKRNRGKS